MKKKIKINCQGCRHFFVTWKSRYPYGCRAFSMESKEFPCKQVLSSSGQECLFFSPKLAKKNHFHFPSTHGEKLPNGLSNSSFDTRI